MKLHVALMAAAALSVSPIAAETLVTAQEAAILCKSPDVLRAVAGLMTEGKRDESAKFANRNRCWVIHKGEKLVVLDRVGQFWWVADMQPNQSKAWTLDFWFKEQE